MQRLNDSALPYAVTGDLPLSDGNLSGMGVKRPGERAHSTDERLSDFYY